MKNKKILGALVLAGLFLFFRKTAAAAPTKKTTSKPKKNMPTKTLEEFVTEFTPFALAYTAKTGLPSSWALAHITGESGYAASGLARNYKNLFGVKANNTEKAAGNAVLLKTTENFTPAQLALYMKLPYAKIYSKTWEAGVVGKWFCELADWFAKYDSYAQSFERYASLINHSRYKKAKAAKTAIEYFTELINSGYGTANKAGYLKGKTELVAKIEAIQKANNLI